METVMSRTGTAQTRHSQPDNHLQRRGNPDCAATRYLNEPELGPVLPGDLTDCVQLLKPGSADCVAV